MKHVLASLTACAALIAFAVTTTEGAQVFAIEDAFAEDDDAGGTIRVRPNGISGGGTNTYDFSKKSWIKFDLTGQSADITQGATFTLTFESGGNNNSDLITVWGLDAGFTPDETNEYDTNWTQSTFTSDGGDSWQNAPANTPGGNGIAGGTGGGTKANGDGAFDSTQATNLGTFDLDTDNDGDVTDEYGNAYSITLTTLGDFVQADNTVTLMIAGIQQNANAVDQQFYNSADSNIGGNDYRPTLDFTVIPEPMTAGLIGLGSIVLLSRRRMR